MDVPDYFTDPNPDGKEWIKRKILASKWELRRTIEEVEFVAEKYQMKKKYGATDDELKKLSDELKELLVKSQNLALEIREFS